MIYLTTEDREKLEAIDRLIQVIPKEYIRELSESDEIIAKIKGSTPATQGIIMKLVDTNTRLNNEVMMLKSETNALRAQLQTLVRVLSKPGFEQQASFDFQTLKNNLGIY